MSRWLIRYIHCVSANGDRIESLTSIESNSTAVAVRRYAMNIANLQSAHQPLAICIEISSSYLS
jgi:hypothetical protein